jgi:hypothetical protein
MFSASEIIPSGGSKYQEKGISESVTITEVVLIESDDVKSLQLKTVNEFGKEGQSKRLSLKVDVSPGKIVAAWTISAKYLQNVILSATKCSVAESQAILKASSVTELKSQLENALVGKSVRGLFSSREYQTGKFAIELYITEPVGGTRLAWDVTNKFYNSVMAAPEAVGDGLPF